MAALGTAAQSLYLPLDVLSYFGRKGIDEGGAAGDRSCVQVHQLGDALGHSVGRACDYDARVAVPQENHFAEILEPDEIDNVCDVGLEVDLRRGEVHPLT